MPGFFISFEGIDGSGKSLQAGLLRDALTERGTDVLVCREPGGGYISEKIRELLLSRDSVGMRPITEVFLYAASRAQLAEEIIKPAIASGKTVICDRYVDSSLAYQGCGRGLTIELVEEVNRRAVNGLMPDVTFYIAVGADEAMRRREKGRGDAPDRLESEGAGFQRRVSDGYEALCGRFPERYVRVDGSRSPEEIHGIILNEVFKRLI